MLSSSILAVDLGNTRAKALVDNQVIALEYGDSWIKEIIKVLQAHDIRFVALASVNLEREEELKLAIINKVEIISAQVLIDKSDLIDFSAISGMGDDRKLGLVGALTISYPPLITVDCGTACTVNVIDENCKCLGGAIFCGPQTQAEALDVFTSKLPKVHLIATENPIGENTNDAINSGIIISTSGAIREFIRLINTKYFPEQNANALITGGAAHLLLPNLIDLNLSYEPALALKGLAMLADKYY